jgi:hypothetical protein
VLAGDTGVIAPVELLIRFVAHTSPHTHLFTALGPSVNLISHGEQVELAPGGLVGLGATFWSESENWGFQVEVHYAFLSERVGWVSEVEISAGVAFRL